MGEQWKDVIGYEGVYQVSYNGRVRSLDRQVNYFVEGNIRINKIKGNTLKNNLSAGYHSVGLCINGKKKTTHIHRIIAIAFIPNPENKREVNHINGIKTDNRIENLEWVSSGENKLHSYSVLKRIRSDGSVGKKMWSKKVINTTTNEVFDSATEAAKHENYNADYFQQCLAGTKKNTTSYKYLQS